MKKSRTMINVNQKLQYNLMMNMSWHSCDTLARKSGVSRQTISGIYNNSAQNVKIETLCKIANALGIKIEDLTKNKK